MGHQITAAILRGACDEAAVRRYELEPISLAQGLTMIPVDIHMLEFWGVRTGNREQHACPVDAIVFPTDDVLFDIMEALHPDPLFAIIQTDYFGGAGSQVAAVYRGRATVMPATYGAINAALRHLGVVARPGQDEFDTVGLGRHRSFPSLDDRDWDEAYARHGLERP
jgi:hypothetical protein